MIIYSVLLQRAVGDSSDFYLYRISYMWYAPLGVLITVIVGLTTSNLFRVLTKDYVPREVDPDFFIPPVANRITRRRRHGAIKTTGS